MEYTPMRRHKRPLLFVPETARTESGQPICTRSDRCRDGAYMRLYPEGKLTVGTYEGAYPHIGEAIFTPRSEQIYGDFMLTVFGAVAELEREYILQRQREGIAIAKEQGKYQGRASPSAARSWSRWPPAGSPGS